MVFSIRRAKKRDDVIVDRVTGAFNRRQLDAVVASGFDTSDQPTATLLIDIDDFERYVTKASGRPGGRPSEGSGDQVLERVSWVIMATVRTTDVVYRHNASGFCALLPATSDEDAFAVADRVRANVAQMPLLAERSVTVSIGVATGTSTDLASTIRCASDALAAGAVAGHNRVFAGGDVRATSGSVVRRNFTSQSESMTQELSPKASAELASVFAASCDVHVDDPVTVPMIAPLASVPLTPPSL
jgi:diguanylate cyclase (GGDEF)-like protein